MIKKLLSILLLLPLISIGQTSAFTSSASSNAFINNAVFTISGGTWTAGKTYVLFVATTRSGGGIPTDNPTISSGSLTLVKQATITNSNLNSRAICYTIYVTSTTTTNITLTYAETQALQFYNTEVNNTDDLAGYTINAATNSGSAANPSITLPSTSTATTIGYFFTKFSNGNWGTAESGWTELLDQGFNNASHAAYARGTTTDNTVDVTASAIDWEGIAIQFIPPPTRKAFIIN